MRLSWFSACALSWLFACAAAAQAASPSTFVEPGTTLAPSAPAPVGACLGGSCAGRPLDPPERRVEPKRPRGGLAFGSAIFGAVSAGVVLGGSIAIAVAHDPDSERITRGVWLGYVAVATPWVALAAYLGRRGSSFGGYRGLRRFGWVAYSMAVVDGVLLWYGAFQDFETPHVLTIGAGALGALALLPHALDAFMSARAARVRRFALAPTGIAVRF